AAALHHSPSRSANRGFTALTAVHVANVLERELSPDELRMPAAKLDGEYLEETGFASRVDAWREAVTTRDFSKLGNNLKGGQGLTMQTTPDDPTPAEERRKAAEFEPAGVGNSRHTWAIVIACIGWWMAAGVWFKLQQEQVENPATGEQPRVIPMPRNVEPKPAVPPQVNRQVVGSPVAEVQKPKPGEAGIETLLPTMQARARTEEPT